MEVFNNMQERKLEILFQRFINKTITDQEKQAFFDLLNLPCADEKLRALAERYSTENNQIIELPQNVSDEILAAILSSEDVEVASQQRVHSMRRFWWAAAILIAVATGGILFLNKKEKQASAIVAMQEDIKAPQTNKATIILANGRRVILDSVSNGTLIDGIARKTADGQVMIEGDGFGVGYLIASNPRNSSALQITLPDKTKIWLNADTYLQYPANYIKDRMISLYGEAYFEVAHDEAKPFRVSAGEQMIEDVGTAFNVKAYKNEATVQTTLLEGKVEINKMVALMPGQKYSNNKITNANIDEVMAWRNGSFYLDGCEFSVLARELERWYDVDVVFNNPGAMHSILFGGEIGRNLSLTKAIGILKDLKVNCRLEGKKLIIE